LIGSWLVRELLARGARVVVIRRDEPAVSPLALLGVADRVDVVAGDICSGGLLERALGDYGVDSVFHLAAQTLVGTAARAPVATFESNVRGTWTVLEACRRVGVERVIVASSDKAYGPALTLPYREEDPLRPLYPYDVSKAACDLIARSYWHAFGLPVAVTRLANVYGGGDLNGSRLVPETVCAALAGAPPVIRSDGSPQRDFLYVSDAVHAYLAVWAALSDQGACGQAFNAGSGEPHRVSDVVELVCRLAGSSVLPDVRGSSVPAGEIDRQWVDSTKLTSLTGWRPSVGLEAGLRQTIEWYQAHPEAQRVVRAS
jgi:CDP-glucose 4,6-dehydratase